VGAFTYKLNALHFKRSVHRVDRPRTWTIANNQVNAIIGLSCLLCRGKSTERLNSSCSIAEVWCRRLGQTCVGDDSPVRCLQKWKIQLFWDFDYYL